MSTTGVPPTDNPVESGTKSRTQRAQKPRATTQSRSPRRRRRQPRPNSPRRLPARPENFRLSDWSTMGKVTDFVLGALGAGSSSAVAVPSPLRFDGQARPGVPDMERTS